MGYTKKTSAKSTATTKINEEVSSEVIKETVTVKPVAPVKTYAPDDYIPCRSVTKGELLYQANKSGELYIWSEYGDTTMVQYQDLNALRVSKSTFLFQPLFMIDDEELVNSKNWESVKTFYDSIYAQDTDELINLSINDFKRIFPTLPKGFQNAVKIEVANQIEAGTFDSLQKIKTIDEVCGSDLAFLLN